MNGQLIALLDYHSGNPSQLNYGFQPGRSIFSKSMLVAAVLICTIIMFAG